jgi:hypothetical protein
MTALQMMRENERIMKYMNTHFQMANWMFFAMGSMTVIFSQN